MKAGYGEVCPEPGVGPGALSDRQHCSVFSHTVKHQGPLRKMPEKYVYSPGEIWDTVSAGKASHKTTITGKSYFWQEKYIRICIINVLRGNKPTVHSSHPRALGTHSSSLVHDSPCVPIHLQQLYISRVIKKNKAFWPWMFRYKEVFMLQPKVRKRTNWYIWRFQLG